MMKKDMMTMMKKDMMTMMKNDMMTMMGMKVTATAPTTLTFGLIQIELLMQQNL